ncbi:MAG: TonB-dependent receptor [Spongiibacteraceae bacterium]|jgi:iron complex outermembrane receptor protein|nr:TonB-dependent receptor [Spongiibacteraceae bacterium]
MKIRRLVAACAALTALGQASPLLAQPGPLEEVIVTASHRLQSLQDVSLSITAVSGNRLTEMGVTQATDLQTVVPGLSVSTQGTNASAFIRGVGSLGTNANASSSIAFAINGVPLTRPSGIGPIFFDLERVEVLKGPQGTLYGTNASGGAINLITKKPAQTFGGSFSVDVGNYDLRRFTGAVDIPFTEELAMRIATQLTRRDGYLEDGYNDQDTNAARVLVRWEPNEKFDAILTGEWSKDESQGVATVPISIYQRMPSDPWAGPSNPILQPPTADVPGIGTRIVDDGFYDNQIRAIGLEMNYEFDFATATFIFGHRDMDNNLKTWTPGFGYPAKETDKATTVELRLAGETDSVDWVAGVFHLKDRQTQWYRVIAYPIQHSMNDMEMDTESHAVFGEVTWSLTDSFRLIAGARYSHDDKGQDGWQYGYRPFNSPVPTQAVSGYGRRTDEEVSWKIGFEYDINENSMIFATVSNGYLAGGFFPSFVYPDNVYDPEELTAWTLASRNQFFNGTLQANFEAFYWDYQDKHERYFGQTTTGSGLLTTNAGSAEIYGIEVDLLWRPTQNDMISFNATWLETEYDEFTYMGFQPNDPTLSGSWTQCRTGPVSDVPSTPAPDSQQLIDCSGMPLVRSPEWSGNLTYQHIFNLQNGFDLVFQTTAQFSSDYYLSPDFMRSAIQDDYVTWDASLTLQKESWYMTVWGRNLTEEDIYTGGARYPFASALANGGDPSLFYSDIRPPRTYGVSFGMNF